MAEVSTVRIPSNPFKTARHLYMLTPFLGDKLFFVDNYRLGLITKKRFEKHLNELDFWFLSDSHEKNDTLKDACNHILKNKIVGGVAIYNHYHKLVSQRIYDKLKGKNGFLITGASKDLAGEKNVCVDPFSANCRLTDDMISIFDGLSKDCDISNWFFLPIAPVIAPFCYKGNGKIELVFKEEADSISEKYQEEGKKPLGDVEKQMEVGENQLQELNSEFRMGFYQFREHLYDYSKAKGNVELPENMPQDLPLEKVEHMLRMRTQLNKEILAYAISKFIPFCGRPVDVYAAKTSYAYDITEKAIKYYNRRADDDVKISEEGVLENIKLPYEGVHHEKALARLKRRIKNRSTEHKNDISDLL